MCLLYTGGGDGTLGFKVIWGCTSPEILYDKKYLFLYVYWKQTFEYINNMIA